MKPCQEKKRVEKRQNNNTPETQDWSDVEALHACLIAEGEPREGIRRGKIEVP